MVWEPFYGLDLPEDLGNEINGGRRQRTDYPGASLRWSGEKVVNEREKSLARPVQGSIHWT